MKTKILIILLIAIGFAANAQQDAQYSHYMYNTISVNPAYAGSRNVLSIFGLHRIQWVGIEGAPTTSTFSINTPLPKNLGAGLTAVSDKIGPTNESTISLDLSYTIKTSEDYKLSFGVKGTANFFSLDKDKLNAHSTTDIALQNITNEFSPNVGAGLFYHSNKSYIGFSVPNFLETKRVDAISTTIYQEKMNFYLIGGYVFDLSKNIKFKPAFLTKVVTGAPLQLDLSGNFLFNEKLVLGVAWRPTAAVSLLAGFQVTNGLFLGYGYDIETTKLIKYNSGSHEIYLRYEFSNKKQEKIISPRFF